MAIRINLLAETQALEDLRRRDPVKRVILAGAVLVALLLAFSSSLMLKTMLVKSDLGRVQGDLNSRTNDYRQVLENKRRLAETNQKLAALHRLSTNRFLIGDFLNAFQKTTVENVQMVHLKLDLNYTVTQEPKAAAKEEGATAGAATPASATEKISFSLNAKDMSVPQGEAVNKYREALSSAPYFKDILGNRNEIRLKSLSAPQTDPEGKGFILFSLEASLPEKKR